MTAQVSILESRFTFRVTERCSDNNIIAQNPFYLNTTMHTGKYGHSESTSVLELGQDLKNHLEHLSDRHSTK